LLLIWALGFPEVKWMLFAVGLTLKAKEKKYDKRAFLRLGLLSGIGAAIAAALGKKAEASTISTGTINVDVLQANTRTETPTIGPNATQQHTVPAAASGTVAVSATSPLALSAGGDVSVVSGTLTIESLIIYASGGHIYSRDGTTGAITDRGTATGAGIQAAINSLASGGKVHIKAGTYTIEASIVPTVSSIDLCGEGDATILSLVNGVNNTPINLSSLSNWRIHDLQIDANKANQTGTSTMGIYVSLCTNVIVENCYVHDAHTFGIQVTNCNDCRIIGNFVKDSDANGIQIENDVSGGRTAAIGNVINGASDVGITCWKGFDVVIAGNIVTNINANTSPFSVNGHVGIDCEQSSSRVVIANNVVSVCPGAGLSSVPSSGQTNSDIIFEGNQVYNVGKGIDVARTNQVLIRNNMFDTTTDVGVNISSGTYASVTGNFFYSIGAQGISAHIAGVIIENNTLVSIAGDAIYSVNTDSGWLVTGNYIDTTTASGNGINTNAGSNWTIMGNTIINCAAAGIRIPTTSSNCIITGNYVASNGTYGILISNANGKNNIVTGNQLLNNTSGQLQDSGTGTVIDNNIGSARITKVVTGTAGENLVLGDVCYPKSDGKYWKAKADAIGTTPTVVMAMDTITANATGQFLLYGHITFGSWTIGGKIYLSAATAGASTQTAPSASGNQVQILGYAYSATVFFFNPNMVVVEIA
jgi:parallel beta-helix repeat protein